PATQFKAMRFRVNAIIAQLRSGQRIKKLLCGVLESGDRRPMALIDMRVAGETFVEGKARQLLAMLTVAQASEETKPLELGKEACSCGLAAMASFRQRQEAAAGGGLASPKPFKTRLWVGTPQWVHQHADFDLKGVDARLSGSFFLKKGQRFEYYNSHTRRDVLGEERMKTEEILAATDCQLLLAMAHLSNEREEELMSRFPKAQPVSHVGVLVPTLRQCFHYFKGDKDAKLFWVLAEAEKEDPEPLEGATMIFCSSPEAADLLRLKLAEVKADYLPLALHEGTSPDEKGRIAREFREGTCQILLTTDMAARGLDFPRVRHVILYDAPVDATAFVHSAGRTARRGSSGLVTCIIEKGDAIREHVDGKIFHALTDGPQLTFAQRGKTEIKADDKNK
ncbi:DED1, partial [Symbiodinium pilosum]